MLLTEKNKVSKNKVSYPKILTSSVDPTKLALTIKGILIGIIPVVVLIAGLTNIDLGQAQLTEFVDALANGIVAISSAISAVMVVVGLGRKILVKLGVVKVAN